MKSKKIIFGIIFGILIVAMVSVIVMLNLPEKEYTEEYLKEESYKVSVEEIPTEYYSNGTAIYDELGNKINNSEVISNEKFIFDNKIGMYGFEIKADIGESTLTYTIKNHSKENQEKFSYRLQLLNDDGSVAGVIDLESKEVPSLQKYKVTLEIDSDISDVYDIVPVTNFETYGILNLGGEYFEG